MNTPTPSRLPLSPMKSAGFIFALCMAVNPVSAQIAAWDFFGETSPATSSADVFSADLDSSPTMTRGTGAASSTGSNSFRTTGFQNNGIATTNTDWFQITLSAVPGKTLSLSTINARFAGTSSFAVSPGVSHQFSYSLDGTNFTLIGSPSVTIGSPATLPEISLAAIPALQNVPDGTTVHLRYYASGQTATGGWGFNSPAAGQYGLAIGGTVGTGGPDTTPPEVATLSPTNGATGVALTPTLTVTFNENIAAGTGLISLFDSSNPGTPVQTFEVGTPAVTLGTNSATFTPSSPLTNGATYHVTIASGAIVDTASPANPFGGISDSTTWSFTTIGPDLTGPVVVTLAPADNLVLETTPAEMSVTFDELIAPGTGVITLRKASDNSVVESFNVASDVTIFNQQLLFYPTVTLTPGEAYYIQIPAGAVVDTAPAANAFGGITDTTSWSFSMRPVPALTLSGPYTQDFSGFASPTNLLAAATLLPEGWRVTGLDVTYDGAWGTGTTGGFRGGANLLGYQHTSSTDVLVKSLTLLNDTGAPITALTISYTGRAALLANTRIPIYTVDLDGNEVTALAYSTASGDGVVRSAAVTGLNIPVGATFKISWTSDRGQSSGSSRQIGISNVSVAAGAALFPPSLGAISADFSTLTPTSVSVSSDVTGDGGSAITARGIIYSVASVNPTPELAGTGVTQVPDAAPATGGTTTPLTGLTPGTEYAIRAYATNGEGTSYSSVLPLFTLPTPPSLVTNYSQGFDNFSGSILTGTLPAGWSVVSSGGVNGFAGTWGPSTSSGGLLGNVDTPNGVLGYQHVGTSGLATVTLTLTNGTGATIDELYLSYVGRVARPTESREPAWTVSLNGNVIPELAYSTAGGVDETKTHVVTGLSIAPGATITLTWVSDGNVGTAGSRRQIGIADVYVGLDAPPPGGYAAWVTANGITGGAEDDDDKDGVSNLIEYALGLTNGTADSLASAFDGSTLTFTAGAEAVAAGDLTYSIETSPDLAGPAVWTPVVTGLDPNDTISYTLPAGVRLFARLRVLQNN